LCCSPQDGVVPIRRLAALFFTRQSSPTICTDLFVQPFFRHNLIPLKRFSHMYTPLFTPLPPPPADNGVSCTLLYAESAPFPSVSRAAVGGSRFFLRFVPLRWVQIHAREIVEMVFAFDRFSGCVVALFASGLPPLRVAAFDCFVLTCFALFCSDFNSSCSSVWHLVFCSVLCL
jgi:hypothetical protein